MPTSIRFPVGLPAPLREGYETTTEETRSRQEREIGAARVRQITSVEPRLETLTWVLTQSQFHEFDFWWQYIIRAGGKPFDIQLSDDDAGLVWYTANWLDGIYQSSIDFERYEWHVSGRVRILVDSFATRAAGTDELRGFASNRVSASGFLIIDKTFHGRATIESSAKGRLSGNGGSLSAEISVTGTARLGALILRGLASIEVTSTADGSAIGVVVGGDSDRLWMRDQFWTVGSSSDIDVSSASRSFMRLNNSRQLGR